MPHAAARSAYVHVPFCAHRCGYCNFTLVARRDDLIDRYLEAIERELSWLKQPHEVDTLFFGGGTPSYLPLDKLRQLVALVRRWFPLAPGYEFSLEANPSDLDEDRVAMLAELGVNRISLGAQSFHADKLRSLDRTHSAEEVERSAKLVQRYVRSLSLDLIFAAPGESLDSWRQDLERALALEPEHMSTYGLTYERGTALWTSWRKGSTHRVAEELERAMFEHAIDRLAAAGFEHYEVSNFARPGHRCRHNEVYWACGSYYAVGPGAARYINGRRQVNHQSTTTYLKRVLAGRSPVAESERLGAEDRAREAFVFGLRRMRGVHRGEFAEQTGFHLDEVGGDELRRFIDRGLLIDEGASVRLSREGLFVSDSIWPHFLRV